MNNGTRQFIALLIVVSTLVVLAKILAEELALFWLPFYHSKNLHALLTIVNILTTFFYPSLWIWIKEEGDMSKAKGRKDISPGKKPGPLTKKERKERKRKRKEKHVLRWMITQILY